jgi:hypothetical protein
MVINKISCVRLLRGSMHLWWFIAHLSPTRRNKDQGEVRNAQMNRHYSLITLETSTAPSSGSEIIR